MVDVLNVVTHDCGGATAAFTCPTEPTHSAGQDVLSITKTTGSLTCATDANALAAGVGEATFRSVPNAGCSGGSGALRFGSLALCTDQLALLDELLRVVANDMLTLCIGTQIPGSALTLSSTPTISCEALAGSGSGSAVFRVSDSAACPLAAAGLSLIAARIGLRTPRVDFQCGFGGFLLVSGSDNGCAPVIDELNKGVRWHLDVGKSNSLCSMYAQRLNVLANRCHSTATQFSCGDVGKYFVLREQTNCNTAANALTQMVGSSIIRLNPSNLGLGCDLDGWIRDASTCAQSIAGLESMMSRYDHGDHGCSISTVTSTQTTTATTTLAGVQLDCFAGGGGGSGGVAYLAVPVGCNRHRPMLRALAEECGSTFDEESSNDSVRH
eukprot:gene3203-26184_t